MRRQLELTELSLQVLAALALYGPLGGAELATRLALSRGSVSSLLTELDARNLVRITPDSRDRRRRTAHLTATGQQLVAEFVELAERALGAAPEPPPAGGREPPTSRSVARS